jgi:opacity protein-like surface antigen
MRVLKASLLALSATVGCALVATAASADGYHRGSVKDAPPCCDSWSGFYLGLHAGYGWKDNDFAEVISVAPLLTIGGIDSRGWLFGGQAGYNWQRGFVVGGLEIDFSKSNIRGSSTPLVRNLGGGVTITDIEGDDVQYLGSARARLGFTGGGWGGGCCSNFLLYATGGLAWERVDRIDTTVLTAPGVTQRVVTRDPRDWFGWVAGVGAEAKLGSSNWIGRIEYLHYDFGTVEQTTSVTTNVANQNFSDSGGKQTIEVLRAAISYKF